MAVSRLDKCTVLVVEDQKEIQSLLVSMLQLLGVGKVLRADDGAQAIDLMKEMKRNPGQHDAEEIDVIVSDWVMPEIDGAWRMAGAGRPWRYRLGLQQGIEIAQKARPS